MSDGPSDYDIERAALLKRCAVEKSQLLGNLERSLHSIRYLISATPSGDRRNELCDVQIHLMAAQDILK